MGARQAGRSVGVGVLGLGFMGRTHLAAYAALQRAGGGGRVVAVCDSEPGRRSGWDESLHSPGGEDSPPNAGDIRFHSSPSALLADREVELVSVCTPTDTHVELGIAALRAGKHVLMEKPVALQPAEIQRLAQAAESSDRFCMPAFCMRFWPGWWWLKQQIGSGTFGRVRSAVFQRVGAMPAWSSFYSDRARSGGALIDLHIHDADFIRWCLGEPDQVCTIGRLDHSTTFYRCADASMHVSAESAWVDVVGFPFRMRYVVAFERAVAEFDSRRDPPLELTRDGKVSAIPFEASSGYDREIRHIVDVILGRAAGPRATLADAQRVAEMLEVEAASLAAGGAWADFGPPAA